MDPAIVSSEDRVQEPPEKPKTRTHYKKEDDWTKGVKVNKESSKGEDSNDTKKSEPKKERVLGELQPVNEKYQKKFDEAYDFNKHSLDDSRKEGGEKKEGEEAKTEKPKYDKNADFFDNITNSTLESNPGRGRGGRGGRGGYRGGNRGGNEESGRGGYRGRGGDGPRGGYKNWREAGEDPFAGTSSYRGRGSSGYRGRGREEFGERK